MVQLSGVFDNGHITLDKQVATEKPVKVLVTFIDDNVVVQEDRLSINNFSFLKSRALLKNVSVNLSEAVIEERRSNS